MRVRKTTKNGGENMSKRRKFYVSADIFDYGLSAQAIAVYAFLSRCAGKEGVAYPSVAKIAQNCRIAESTVRTTITGLERCGLLRREEHYVLSGNGKLRQTSNRYYLTECKIEHPSPSDETEGGCQMDATPPPAETGEIYDEYKDMNKSISVSLYEENGLTEILERLSLHSYEDIHFANAVELAVRDMYYAEHITVGGEKIPQRRVRERLSHLDTSCLDLIYSRMRDYGVSFQSAGRYLISCLYNAPVDFNTDLAAFCAAM